MNTVEAIQQAGRNQRERAEADLKERERERAMRASQRDREREAEAALRARTEAMKPKTFANEPVPWGLPGAREGKPRTLARFVHNAAQVRDDQVGRLCRLLQKDDFDLADPTTLIRRLALCCAPTEWLAAACELIRDYRRWHDEGVEAEFREVERVNPERARVLRESLHESRTIVARHYDEDAKA